ncbi:MAG: response regulator [Pseudanabaena sp.]|jgi:CheY-like chemotaxis protein|nr:response regulator [Pseudanabaena sp. M090S1SP2A07QC]MCA6508326.1 response regulator [Pseudanabaena sp. M172S2SP2A07QC]MCA6520307.1 response regulator [Pseudanabaena sp. M051S1SP2A07QC]MCA6527696.1 response regulator [Pseudanabaena sp. M179S2SP2A07QC]MCA6531260.1 response regulator [Pseudanabaena sp. M125S2SP2A07QC]MCA6534598.1 response regulator [Pseudanabaena sp. M176S2SP2A07QC]MCA6540375.1 response regulator [Pseudanabaena sp. M037S2SP2A07QC]MCA6543462.1 response regulator [Pseudanabae
METQQASCKTILLIDDEDYILQIVEACIENFSNWRPALAASGDEGLAAAAKAKPDAILLDMMMPNMDGFTFLKNLKADPQLADIPVVLITARLDLLETQKLSQLGVKGAIAKPFHATKLVDQITKILGW